MIQKIEDERYNLEGYLPILTEVKREQTDETGWCNKDLFKTNYLLVKIYNIGGNRIRIQSIIKYRYEHKDKDVIEGEDEGEKYRLFLENKYKNIATKIIK